MKRFTDWKPISFAFHDKPGMWHAIENAPMTYQQARKAFDDGVIHMANKRLEDRTLLVVKLPVPR